MFAVWSAFCDDMIIVDAGETAGAVLEALPLTT
jgi:hypothetical protein